MFRSRNDGRSGGRPAKGGGGGGFGGKGFKKYADRDSGGRSFGGRDKFSMHQAVCDKCGESCEVPFKPSGEKPVYCSNCFVKGDSSGRDRGADKYEGRRESSHREAPRRESGPSQEQFEMINQKLDRIIKLLSSSEPL